MMSWLLFELSTEFNSHSFDYHLLAVASFREISRIVADNWKNLEPTTQHYVQAVASILKERHAFITSELKHQGTGWCENGPNKRHTQSPIVWRAIEQHQEQRQPTPSPVPIDWPNMMGLLPENNAPQVPYCGVCDYSSNLLEPIAFMPTIPTQVPIQANYVSQESLRLQDDVQLHLQIAANITQHDVLPSECYHSNFQPVFCGDCTDAWYFLVRQIRTVIYVWFTFMIESRNNRLKGLNNHRWWCSKWNLTFSSWYGVIGEQRSKGI